MEEIKELKNDTISEFLKNVTHDSRPVMQTVPIRKKALNHDLQINLKLSSNQTLQRKIRFFQKSVHKMK